MSRVDLQAQVLSPPRKPYCTMLLLHTHGAASLSHKGSPKATSCKTTPTLPICRSTNDWEALSPKWTTPRDKEESHALLRACEVLRKSPECASRVSGHCPSDNADNN